MKSNARRPARQKRKEAPLTFTQWLAVAQASKKTRVGDFARNVAQDGYWPVDASTRDEVYWYLEERGILEYVYDAFDMAWRRYAKAVKKGTARKEVHHE
jgi:uncharacterized protein YozE (UPF0346 family)